MRQVSLSALQGLLKEQVTEVFLQILKIEHEGLEEPLLLVRDRANITRSDGEYTAFPFTIKLPDEEEENIATVDLTFPVVDHSMVQILRGTNEPFTVTLSVIKASTPDKVEAGPFVLESLGIDFEGPIATITLGVNRNMFEDMYAKDIFSPSNRVDA